MFQATPSGFRKAPLLCQEAKCCSAFRLSEKGGHVPQKAGILCS